MDTFITEQYNIYKSDLIDFKYITHANLYIIKPGGIIKYVNLNGELKYGGIVIKILDDDKYTTLKFLLKLRDNYYTIYYSKNYIFYTDPIKKSKKKTLKDLLTELSSA